MKSLLQVIIVIFILSFAVIGLGEVSKVGRCKQVNGTMIGNAFLLSSYCVNESYIKKEEL